MTEIDIRRRVVFPMLVCASVLVAGALCDMLAVPAFAYDGPLPSWNDGPAKKAIEKFVADATRYGSPGFVPMAERIAVFDNDGTLWVEQPIYAQMAFAVDRVKVLAPRHPEWKTQEPYKSILTGDLQGALAGGEHAILALVMAAHSDITTDEFNTVVERWLARTKHPRFKQPYTDCVYQPMLELMNFLRAASFKVYIVSGGGVEFMRVFAEKVYGVPPEQVIGSSGKLKYGMKDGTPVLMKQPEIDFVDDGPGKPVGIQKYIGRRPVFAFGNSDGDQQMLQWTAAGPGAHFMGIVRHTDATREWAYDRASSIGKLDKALDEATAKGWTVVDMKSDWKKVFASE